jgi:hypothetical protein
MFVGIVGESSLIRWCGKSALCVYYGQIPLWSGVMRLSCGLKGVYGVDFLLSSLVFTIGSIVS